MAMVAGVLAAFAMVHLESRVSTGRIEVGPDVLVSRDSEDPHVEMTVAADLRDPKVLLGASMILPSLRSYPEAPTGRLYSSRNGGHTWDPVRLPGNGSAVDPQVAFGVSGTAFYVGTWFEAPGGGNKNLLVFRSTDRGRTWSDPVDLGAPADHDVVAVDHTQGPYRGRFYVASFSKLTNNDFAAGRGSVVVYRSTDDGRTFAAPVVAMKARANMSVIAYSSHVLSDGTLVIGVLESFWRPDAKARTGSYPSARFVMVASSDGGATFGAPWTVHDFGDTDWQDFAKVRTQFAVAADVSKGPFRDRLYAVWTDPRNPRSRLVRARSDAGGRTWSEPVEIAAGTAVGSEQFQPAAAVNAQGVLGVSWLESPEPETGRYDVYFTASLDGGRTFLDPVRVSSRPSTGRGLGNLLPVPILPVQRSGQGLIARLSSAHASFPTGGDYTGMAADADGVFHPFWPDSRRGVFQVFTSRIRVRSDDYPEPERSTVTAPVNELVTLLFDPVQSGPEKGSVTIPMRLQNTSGQRIHGPLRATVRRVVPENAIQNAANGKPGVGAVFDFTSALRDVGYLDPEAVTEAVDVRLVIGDRRVSEVVLDVEVTGAVERRK